MICATFSGKLKRKDGVDEVDITDGRFDVNWVTIADAMLPKY